MTSTRIRSLPLLLTLTAGILSFILLSTLESRIQNALSSRSRELLGADLALSSRRWIQPSELAAAEAELRNTLPGVALQKTQVLEIFTMAALPGTGNSSQAPQLVELNAIEPQYPLVGGLELEPGCPAGQACVHADATLAIRWNLKPGTSRIRIGEKEFIWGGRIQRDTSRSLRGGSLAPRVVLPRAELASTGLLRSGATFTTRTLFASKGDRPSSTALALLSERLNRVIRDPGIQIQIPADAAADEGRLLSQVGDFLGLTSLVGLILAFLGCVWLLRRLVQQHAQSWAIYRVLSPEPWRAHLPFARMAVSLSISAAALSLAVSQLAWSAAGPALSRFLLMEGRLETWIPASTALQAAVLSIFTLGFALLPSLRFLSRQNLMELLKNPAILAQRPGFTVLDVAIVLVVLLAVARWVAHSWKVAGLFMAGLTLSALVTVLIGLLALKFLERASRIASNVAQRHSLIALSRLRASSLMLWSTFSLGAMLISLMPLLESSLRVQLSDPREAGPVPSLFLFDIQEEQLRAVQSWAASQATALQFVTPLIRGRLLKVNDTAFEKLSDAPTTREEEREARFRNRGFNLTYREGLTPSERLVQGVLPSQAALPGDIEAVTLERRFAQRLGIRIGDRLDFDIQGVPLSAQVVGIRSVQWTSFQPNFFIVFAPRALVDAPKTYLASIPNPGSRTGPEFREALQRTLFDRFANISTIDVTRLMETLLEGFGQISQALALMALLSSLAGGMAIFSVARLRSQERLPELQLIKLLGMPVGQLQASLAGELAVLAATSAVTGLALATGLAGAMSRWIFESPVQWPSASLCMAVVAGFLAAGSILGTLASRRVVAQAPERWLKSLGAEG